MEPHNQKSVLKTVVKSFSRLTSFFLSLLAGYVHFLSWQNIHYKVHFAHTELSPYLNQKLTATEDFFIKLTVILWRRDATTALSGRSPLQLRYLHLGPVSRVENFSMPSELVVMAGTCAHFQILRPYTQTLRRLSSPCLTLFLEFKRQDLRDGILDYINFNLKQILKW